MSFVSDQQWELVAALAQGKISEEAFCKSISIDAREAPGIGLEILSQARDRRDADGVEFALFLAHSFGFTDEYLPLLLHLAGENWHTQHENIADGLARLRAPSSVSTLYKLALARLDYLDYDEAFALGVKCIWALGSIASEEAVARLADLLSCGNGIIVENAENQLSLLREEAESEVVRAAARAVLDERSRRRFA